MTEPCKHGNTGRHIDEDTIRMKDWVEGTTGYEDCEYDWCDGEPEDDEPIWPEIKVVEDAEHVPQFDRRTAYGIPEGTYRLVPEEQIKMLGRLADLAGLLKDDDT